MTRHDTAPSGAALNPRERHLREVLDRCVIHSNERPHRPFCQRAASVPDTMPVLAIVVDPAGRRQTGRLGACTCRVHLLDERLDLAIRYWTHARNDY
jgi:hypothetical protein